MPKSDATVTAFLRGLRLFIAVAAALGAAGMLPRMAAAAPQVVTLNDGREYLIDLPANRANAPLIVALHGGGGNPQQFSRASGLSRPANRLGYAVIYPKGSGRRLLTWNGGYCCGPAARERVDDIGFLDAVIADAADRFGLNPARVFLTGMSNGAILAEAYAAARPDAVRAVAGVAGTLDLAQYPPQRAVPLLHIHGTADTHVPYDGGPGSKGLTTTRFTPVNDVIAAFYALNGHLVRTDRKIDKVDDGMSVAATTWSAGGHPVIRLLTVEGGGHVWPGGRRAQRQDNATGDIDATTEILRFFTENR